MTRHPPGGLTIAFLMTIGLGLPVFTQARTFEYTGTVQTYVVPAGVTSLKVEAEGAAGNSAAAYYLLPHHGGRGAFVSAKIPVTPGETLFVRVGGMGIMSGLPPNTPRFGGFNGGGDAGGAGGYAGGGASDVRRGGDTLAHRVVVAGGGGAGGGYYGVAVPGGNAGAIAEGGSFNGGGAASLLIGGEAGQNWSTDGSAGTPPTAGSLGQGGSGGEAVVAATQVSGAVGGGGGGGFFGGGGGGGNAAAWNGGPVKLGGGGGGAGSSYVTPAASAVEINTVNGWRNGIVRITSISKQVVSTEAELREALLDERFDTIELASDIMIHSELPSIRRSLDLEGEGHVLHAATGLSLFAFQGGTLTIRGVEVRGEIAVVDGDPEAIVSGKFTMGEGGTLRFTRSTIVDCNATIDGNVQIIQGGTGLLRLSAALANLNGLSIATGGSVRMESSMNGSITNDGHLIFDTGIVTEVNGAIPLPKTFSVTGNISGSGEITTDGDGTVTLSGVISGSGKITKKGPGRLFLSGANTYMGGTTIEKGTVTFFELQNFGTGPLTFAGGGLSWADGNTADISTLPVNFGAETTFATGGGNVRLLHPIGAGSNVVLNIFGEGTLSFATPNAFPGPVLVWSALHLEQGASLNQVQVKGSATLTLAPGSEITQLAIDSSDLVTLRMEAGGSGPAPKILDALTVNPAASLSFMFTDKDVAPGETYRVLDFGSAFLSPGQLFVAAPADSSLEPAKTGLDLHVGGVTHGTTVTALPGRKHVVFTVTNTGNVTGGFRIVQSLRGRGVRKVRNPQKTIPFTTTVNGINVSRTVTSPGVKTVLESGETARVMVKIQGNRNTLRYRAVQIAMKAVSLTDPGIRATASSRILTDAPRR